jgi:hypothetical protein
MCAATIGLTGRLQCYIEFYVCRDTEEKTQIIALDIVLSCT